MTSIDRIVGSDGADTLVGGAGAELIYGFDPDGPQDDISTIAASRVATGLDQPLFVAGDPTDPDRLFVLEKSGVIRVVDQTKRIVSATPVLDVSTEIVSEGEQGLLGLAFHPDFARNGKFYVYLSNLQGDSEIREYRMSEDDPGVADPSSGRLVLRIDQPVGRLNHKAGWIGFGEDGALYIASGDGGGSGDPDGNGQNLDVLLGKILRIDVDGDDFAADPDRNYAIPDDNPFVGRAGLDEVWAYGLRNPYRDGFDRGTGQLFIADVGQARWEEIDLGAAGANYGWDLFEGPDPFPAGAPPPPSTGITFPIHAYDHSVGNAVIGGYVYRGSSEALHGEYFFADLTSDRVWTLSDESGDWTVTDRTGQVVPDVGSIDRVVSFGEDAQGNLFIVDIAGDVFRLDPQTVSADLGDTLGGRGGDDRLFGGSADDRLLGGADDDLLAGQAGDDLLNGGSGRDSMAGGLGDDTYLVDRVEDAVLEASSEGIDFISSGVDFTLPDNVENLALRDMAAAGIGNGLGNRLSGNAVDNVLTAGAGKDRLRGHGGADILRGEGGDDELKGGDGADILWGGGGTDRLLGGNPSGGAGDGDLFIGGGGRDLLYATTGDDRFDINAVTESRAGSAARDTIFGFEADVIDLRGVDANSGAAGNQAFAFVGSAAFSGTAGELRLAAGLLEGDIDGDGAADLQVALANGSTATAGDLLL